MAPPAGGKQKRKRNPDVHHAAGAPSSTSGRRRARRPRDPRGGDAAVPSSSSARRSHSSTPTPDGGSGGSRPPWAPSEEDFPWSASAAIHGECPNVSERYEKVGSGRIGEGTYGAYMQDYAPHTMCVSYAIDYVRAFSWTVTIGQIDHMQGSSTRPEIGRRATSWP